MPSRTWTNLLFPWGGQGRKRQSKTETSQPFNLVPTFPPPQQSIKLHNLVKEHNQVQVTVWMKDEGGCGAPPSPNIPAPLFLPAQPFMMTAGPLGRGLPQGLPGHTNSMSRRQSASLWMARRGLQRRPPPPISFPKDSSSWNSQHLLASPASEGSRGASFHSLFSPSPGSSTMESHHLVPGDLLLLEGQRFSLPCDAILLEGSCVVNEGMLTGTSWPAGHLRALLLPTACGSGGQGKGSGRIPKRAFKNATGVS